MLLYSIHLICIHRFKIKTLKLTQDQSKCQVGIKLRNRKTKLKMLNWTVLKWVFLAGVLMYQKHQISLPVGYKTARPKTGEWEWLWSQKINISFRTCISEQNEDHILETDVDVTRVGKCYSCLGDILFSCAIGDIRSKGKQDSHKASNYVWLILARGFSKLPTLSISGAWVWNE